MNGFSLRLLDNEVARQWLMCRKEPYIPAHIIESSVGICGDTYYGGERERMHFLMRPIGVVDNIMLGLKLGATYPFALPKNFDGVPLCRRFAVDLESLEKLEFHWFSNDTLLVDWMQFPSEQERLRYLVLFEAPPIGKRPAKLLRSTEVVSLKDSLFSGQLRVETIEGELHEWSASTFSLSTDEQNVFHEGVSYISHALGLFHGSLRTTVYDEDGKPLYTYDSIVPIETGIHVVRSSKTEYLKTLEMQRHCVYRPIEDMCQLYGVEMPSGKLRMLLEKEQYMWIYRFYDEKVVQAAIYRRLRKKKMLRKHLQGISSSSEKCKNEKNEWQNNTSGKQSKDYEPVPVVSATNEKHFSLEENIRSELSPWSIEEEFVSSRNDVLLDQSVERDLFLFFDNKVATKDSNVV